MKHHLIEEIEQLVWYGTAITIGNSQLFILSMNGERQKKGKGEFRERDGAM